MRHLLAAVATIGCLVAPPQVAAQSAAELCREMFSNLTPGAWAEYDFSGVRGPQGMKMAVVGKEGSGRDALYWFEFSFQGEMGSMIMKALVPGWPYDPGQVREMIMKMGDRPAMKMPAQALTMMRDRSPTNVGLESAQKCGDADVVGRESITVPAGTLNTVHLRPTEGEGDLWVSSDVPFGMVRWVSTSGEEVTLTDHGTGATTAITETPIEGMPGMGGWRRP